MWLNDGIKINNNPKVIINKKICFTYFADVNVKNMDNPSTARPPILNTIRK